MKKKDETGIGCPVKPCRGKKNSPKGGKFWAAAAGSMSSEGIKNQQQEEQASHARLQKMKQPILKK